jgi:hypothetical protein
MDKKTDPTATIFNVLYKKPAKARSISKEPATAGRG